MLVAGRSIGSAQLSFSLTLSDLFADGRGVREGVRGGAYGPARLVFLRVDQGQQRSVGVGESQYMTLTCQASRVSRCMVSNVDLEALCRLAQSRLVMLREKHKSSAPIQQGWSSVIP